MKNKIIFLLVVLLAANTLFSQTEENTTVSSQAQKIKIRAKRDVKDPLNTSLATTIITGDELKAKGANNLADALRDNIGMQVLDQGTSSTLNIRGVKSEQVVILINGQKLNKAQGLGVDLSAYSVENVERIEVIRGGAATRYGANAMGGVINIITKDKVDKVDGIEASVNYGSYNKYGVSALASKSFGKNNQGSIFISGVLNTSKGNFPYNYTINDTKYEGKVPNNDSLNASVRAGINYKFNDKDIISFDASVLDDDKGLSGQYTGGFSKDRQTVQNYAGNFSYENNSFDIFSFIVRANVLKQSKTYRGTWSSDKYDNISSSVSADFNRVDKFGGDLFTFKNNLLLEYQNEYFYTENPRGSVLTGDPNSVARNNISIAYLPDLGFLNFEGTEISRLTLTPAIRFDAIMGYGARENKNYYEPSYSLGAMYTIDRDRRYNIKANFNTGYRIPSFDDLYNIAGNTDLKKENSLSGDVGFIITPHDIIRFEALYYITKIDNIITWVPKPLPTDQYNWSPINIDKSLFQGVEANLVLSVPIKPILSRAELNINYLYQFGKILSDRDPSGNYIKNNKLTRTPENTVNLLLAYIFEGNEKVAGRLNFYTHYIGERYNDLLNKQKIDDTLTFDLTASITLLDTITIDGGVKNLTDTRYQNVIGYPQIGREVFASISAKF